MRNGDSGIDSFAKVMGSHIGRHTNRNTLRPVNDQVGETGGEDLWFDFGAVIVRNKIDGILIDIADHF